MDGHPQLKALPADLASAGDRLSQLLQENPRAKYVVHLTEAELRRGWRLGEILARCRGGKVRLLGPELGLVE